MNNDDRKAMEEVLNILEHARERMSGIHGEMEERTCNFEDTFEGSEKAERMRDQTDRALEITDELEDLKTRLEELMSE